MQHSICRYLIHNVQVKLLICAMKRFNIIVHYYSMNRSRDQWHLDSGHYTFEINKTVDLNKICVF